MDLLSNSLKNGLYAVCENRLYISEISEHLKSSRNLLEMRIHDSPETYQVENETFSVVDLLEIVDCKIWEEFAPCLKTFQLGLVIQINWIGADLQIQYLSLDRERKSLHFSGVDSWAKGCVILEKK